MRTGSAASGQWPRVTPQRAARLYRLLSAVAKKPSGRDQLVKMSRTGTRTFYRDLTFLEQCHIQVRCRTGRYYLATPLDQALGRLPFPPLQLSFAEAMELAKGTGKAHRKVRAQLRRLTG